MSDKQFEVIKGGNDNSDLTKPIGWERPDKGEKVLSIRPTAMKAFISERRLRLIAESLKANPSVHVTYSKFDEEDKRRKKEMDELREMFRDNDKVIVFDSTDKHR